MSSPSSSSFKLTWQTELSVDERLTTRHWLCCALQQTETTSSPAPTVGLVTEHFLSLLPKPGTVYPQTSRSLPAQRTLSNNAWRPGSSNGPMIDIRTSNITIILSVFYDHHYHHRYHYSYHNFIITILCYAPSINSCTVGGAIQMTVYIT